MQRTTVVTAFVTAVVFAVAGCVASKPAKLSVLRHDHGSQDCRKKRDCEVTIRFVCVDLSNPSTCEPYAGDEVVVIDSATKKINFEIDQTTNFEFDPTDGIKFTKYITCQPQGNQRFECDTNNAPPALYKYRIHVQGMLPVDPWVVNY